MANQRAQALAPYLDNPNVQTMLDLIAAAEGTTQHGYNTMFGGSRLDSLADHPRRTLPFTQTDGRQNRSSAAGRYQFIQGTWDDVAQRLGLEDFSERSQDLGALELLRRAGALDAVAEGDFATALERSGRTWASLPNSPYPQPTRSQEWVNQFLADRGLADRGLGESNPTVTPMPLEEAIQATLQVAGTIPSILQQTPNPLQPIAAAAQAAPQALGGLYDVLGLEPSSTSLPSWLASVESIQAPQEPEPLEPWEQQLMASAFEADADAARNEAVSAFFGEPATPALNMPDELSSTINRIIAQL